MKKVLVLDVDGVLNCKKVLQEATTNHALGEDHLVLLKKIVDLTGCEILLSSTWRLWGESKRELKFAFNRHKIVGGKKRHWIGETPDFHAERWTEIHHWVSENIKEECNLVILDDDSDANLTAENSPANIKATFVHTHFNTGLDEKAFQEVLTAFGTQI